MIYPKPPPKQPAVRKPLKRTRVKRVRAKARAGRLKGAEMSELREAAWARDKGICQRCYLPCDQDGWDLAHHRGKRMWGDSLPNVSVKHKACHRVEHAYGPSGIKPVPAKERA